MKTLFNLDLDSKVEKSFYVRKRKKAGKIYLIYLSNLYKIDRNAEFIWDNCEGDLTILDLLSLFKCKNKSMQVEEILEAIFNVLAFFQSNRLVTFLPSTDNTKENLESDFLTIIMQYFHKSSTEPWYRGATLDTKQKLLERFYQILYESYSNNHNIENLASKDDFKNMLIRDYEANFDKILYLIKKDLGLKSWSFSKKENKIEMLFDFSVYVGDIENRL